MRGSDAQAGRISCLHILPSTERAGAETRARELIEGLVETGRFDFEIAYFSAGHDHGRFLELGVPMLEVRKRRALAFDLARMGRRFREHLADRQPRILHTWLTGGNVVGLYAARRWPRTKVVITQCGGGGEAAFLPVKTRLQGVLMGRADHAISNSPEGADALVRLGMDERDVSVVLNGIAPARVETTRSADKVRRELGTGESKLVVVVTRANDRYAARQKNFAGLFAAVERLRDAMLVVVGPTREQLSASGVTVPGQVRLTGFADRPADYLAAADVVAIPSLAEGTSNVACEALMLGRPVATTAVGGHVAVVEEAGGAVVPPADSEALAEAISSLLERPPSPERVRSVAERRLGHERMVRETAEIYGRLATEGAAVATRPEETSGLRLSGA
jgi:glycosyltransferase involved in cell wall biosynthesis